MPVQDPLIDDALSVQTIFDCFDRSETPQTRLNYLFLLGDIFRAMPGSEKPKIQAWLAEMQRKVFYLYSDPDQLRFDKPRFVARIFDAMHSLSEEFSNVAA
jgi:hypothetical protein